MWICIFPRTTICHTVASITVSMKTNVLLHRRFMPVNLFAIGCIGQTNPTLIVIKIRRRTDLFPQPGIVSSNIWAHHVPPPAFIRRTQINIRLRPRAMKGADVQVVSDMDELSSALKADLHGQQLYFSKRARCLLF